jgi:1-deoxy-D-xylulose-5-phosphate synthase
VGNRVYPALAAAAQLESQGISAAVVNPRFLKPLDSQLIADWATKTGRVIAIEDNSALGGFGSGVLQLLNEHGLYLPVKILGYSDSFVEHGPQATLWHNAGIDVDGIVRSVQKLLHQ